MNTDICSFTYFLDMSYYFWMMAWVKNVSNFQIAKVGLGVLPSICLFFCQFHPGVAYKRVAY